MRLGPMSDTYIEISAEDNNEDVTELVKLVAEGRAQVGDHAGRITVRAADRFRHDAIDKF